jgi:hypothetical protein
MASLFKRLRVLRADIGTLHRVIAFLKAEEARVAHDVQPFRHQEVVDVQRELRRLRWFQFCWIIPLAGISVLSLSLLAASAYPTAQPDSPADGDAPA